MPLQTVDARPQKRRKGETPRRGRRAARAACSAGRTTRRRRATPRWRRRRPAPPADAVAALYEKILEDVGSAAKENEAPWDAALRLACARHLSSSSRRPATRLARSPRLAGPPTLDETTPGRGCASRASRESRRAAAAARVAVGGPSARPRAAPSGRTTGRSSRPRARGRQARVLPRGRGGRPPPPPAPGRWLLADVDGLGSALLAARAALARDARAGRATLDHPAPWSGSPRRRRPRRCRRSSRPRRPGMRRPGTRARTTRSGRGRRRRAARMRRADGGERGGRRRRGAAARRARLRRAPRRRAPPKPPDGVAAARFAARRRRRRRRRGCRRAAVLAAPRRVRDHLAAFVAAAAPRRGRGPLDDAAEGLREAAAAVDRALTRPRSWRSPRSIAPRSRARGSTRGRADRPTPRRGSTGWPPRARRRGATLLLRGPSSKPARGRYLGTAASTPVWKSTARHRGKPAPGSVER